MPWCYAPYRSTLQSRDADLTPLRIDDSSILNQRVRVPLHLTLSGHVSITVGNNTRSLRNTGVKPTTIPVKGKHLIKDPIPPTISARYTIKYLPEAPDFAQSTSLHVFSLRNWRISRPFRTFRRIHEVVPVADVVQVLRPLCQIYDILHLNVFRRKTIIYNLPTQRGKHLLTRPVNTRAPVASRPMERFFEQFNFP